MRSRNLKRDAAFRLITSSEDLLRRFPQLKNMLRESVYNRLTQLGYAWSVAHGRWELKFPENKSEVTVVQFTEPKGSNRVEIRVMCHADIATEVVHDLDTLLSLADLEVRSISEPRVNRDGKWVRIYIRARRI